MRIGVKSDTVRQNIERFKAIVRRVEEKAASTTEKTYKAYINRKTGEFAFDGERGSQEEWKPVRIRLHRETGKQKCGFAVLPEKEREDCFKVEDLTPVACRIIGETVSALNLVPGHDIPEVLGELAAADVVKRDIIHEAWHQVERARAESLLEEKPPGTFLFRKDEYATVLESELRWHFQKPIHCVTLTYRGDANRVIDRTLVLADQRWQFYNDDPSLRQTSYDSVEALLASLGAELKTPLYHDGI
jgi:hypothetical protein